MSNCPKTSVWIRNPVERDLRDVIYLKEFKDLVYPVMIRGEPNNVYELKDIVQWFRTSGGKSPTTRNLFRLEDLEPVRYPGFQGYARTILELKRITSDGWREMPDAANWPSVSEGEEMEPPQWTQDIVHPVCELPPLEQDDILGLQDQYKAIQELSKHYLYDHLFITTLKDNIDNLRRVISSYQGGIEALRQFDEVHATISDILNDEKCLMENYKLFQGLISENAANSDNHFSITYRGAINLLRRKISYREGGDAILRLFDGVHNAMLSHPYDPEDIATLSHSYNTFITLTTTTGIEPLQRNDPWLFPLRNTINETRERITRRQGGEEALRRFDAVHPAIPP